MFLDDHIALENSVLVGLVLEPPLHVLLVLGLGAAIGEVWLLKARVRQRGRNLLQRLGRRRRSRRCGLATATATATAGLALLRAQNGTPTMDRQATIQLKQEARSPRHATALSR
eukprot:c16028_g1_i2.p1 GENE.c16028_g1_i2~~c16028_g1_i2.p1  ORF type:complete len:114 (-),score=1.41 c16028_g1_i2:212-553(-)